MVITAGPTHEPIDPVRFLGNRSTGTMGFALAAAALSIGAEVTLISGPVSLPPPHPAINRIDVETALEMKKACETLFSSADLFIMCAAVADYRPAEYLPGKIKKSDLPLTLHLTPNPDILAGLGQIKTHQILIGFALETDNELQNAQKKLLAKNADSIILNSLSDDGAGFGVQKNKVTILSQNSPPYPIPLLPKPEVARQIMNFLLEHYF